VKHIGRFTLCLVFADARVHPLVDAAQRRPAAFAGVLHQRGVEAPADSFAGGGHRWGRCIS